MSGGGKIIKNVGSALGSVANPFSAISKIKDTLIPEIDTSDQTAAIRETARQQAEQAAESARATANQQASAAQREQLLAQRSEEEKAQAEDDADVRVGDTGTADTARKRRQQFQGDTTSGSQSASIRI